MCPLLGSDDDRNNVNHLILTRRTNDRIAYGSPELIKKNAIQQRQLF